MIALPAERRRYARYDTAMKIYFKVSYDIKTKVKFQLVDEHSNTSLQKKYSGVSKDISVEGLCFSSNKQLKKGDVLNIEIYLPRQEKPICVIGKVRWSLSFARNTKHPSRIYTGVQLVKVNDKAVAGTIHYDKTHGLIWSIVLDSIFGSYSKFMKKLKG